MVVRIDELKLLKRGWLDSKGEALDPQKLDWFMDAFKSFFPDQTKLPYLFPTPEGNLLAEWSLDTNSVSLEIDLNNRSAEWHVLNLVTNEEETKQFDLNVPDSWKTIADNLRVTCNEPT